MFIAVAMPTIHQLGQFISFLQHMSMSLLSLRLSPRQFNSNRGALVIHLPPSNSLGHQSINRANIAKNHFNLSVNPSIHSTKPDHIRGDKM